MTPPDTPTAMEILEKTHEFYDSAWTRLVWVVGVAFAVGGVLMPLAIEWYRRHSATSDLNRLKAELKEETAKLVNRLVVDATRELTRLVVQLSQSVSRTYDYEAARAKGEWARAAREAFRGLSNARQGAVTEAEMEIWIEHLGTALQRCRYEDASKPYPDPDLLHEIRAFMSANDDLGKEGIGKDIPGLVDALAARPRPKK